MRYMIRENTSREWVGRKGSHSYPLIAEIKSISSLAPIEAMQSIVEHHSEATSSFHVHGSTGRPVDLDEDLIDAL